MLDLFRRQASNLVGVGIVFVIAIVFIFSFGPQSSGWGKGRSVLNAATVYGDSISESSFRWAYVMNGGRSIPLEDQKRTGLKESTLQGLIERQLMVRRAREIGLAVSDDDVDSSIIRGEFLITKPIDQILQDNHNYRTYYRGMRPPVLLLRSFVRNMNFEKEGRFDYEGFRMFVLHHLESNLKAFKEEQRMELLAHRLRQVVSSAVQIGEEELFGNYVANALKIKLAYIRLIPVFFQETFKPDASDIEKWAMDNKTDIDQYYQHNIYQYTNLERQAHARRILLKIDEKAGDDNKKEKKALADRTIRRLRRGEDFAEVAREVSNDTESGRKGGDLGWVPKGRLEPALEEALFNLSPGKISGVIESREGLNILKLEGFREGDISVEAATPEIASQLYREKMGEDLAQGKADEYLKRLKDGESLENIIPDTISAQDPLAPKVQETPLFSRRGNRIPDIGDDPVLAETVFKLTEENPLADKPVRIGKDFYVIKLIERTDPSREEFLMAKDVIKSELLEQKRIDAVGAYIKDLINKAVDDDAIWRNTAILTYPEIQKTQGRSSDEESDKAGSSPPDTAGTGSENNESSSPQNSDTNPSDKSAD